MQDAMTHAAPTDQWHGALRVLLGLKVRVKASQLGGCSKHVKNHIDRMQARGGNVHS